MIEVTYFAKRSLKSGITAGDEVTLEFNATQMSPSVSVDKDMSKSLSGVKQSTLHNYLNVWNITGYRTDGIDYEDWNQFLNSVIGGEIFTLTDYDSEQEFAVVMTSGYSKQRITNFQQNDFQYTFTCEEQPN